MAAEFTTNISSPSESLVIASPTFSASSLSSSGFDFIAARQGTSDPELHSVGTSTASAPLRPRPNPQSGAESSFSDDDEIVWNISESEDVDGSTSGLGAVLSDDDFVVLSNNTPSKSMYRTRASRSAAGRAGVIRNVPLKSGILEPHPSINLSQVDNVDPDAARSMNDKGTIASELAKELAKLSLEAHSFAGESNGTGAPIEGDLLDPESKASGDSLKEREAKEKVVGEEASRRQRKNERKEKKKREEQSAKALRKVEKEKAVTAKVPEGSSKHKQSNGSIVVTPPPVAPELSRSASTATLVPASTNINHVSSQPLSALENGEESTPVPTLLPLPSPHSEAVKSPRKKKKSKKSKVSGPHQRDTVQAEKVSEQTSDNVSTPSPYDEAVSYITSYITNTSAHHDPVCHLTLLQSLIIELGLLKDVSFLPRSIKAAKKFIRPRVFLNVKEYVTKRQQGPQVVRSLMFPSRSALVKDMKKKKSYASLKWIKKRGLQDLLVGIFDH